MSDHFDMICCIVNCGAASKALRIAKQHGVRGGTICLGSGTVKNKLLELLDLDETRKEILFMGVRQSQCSEIMQLLSKEMSFHKPNHGIIFSFSLKSLVGTRNFEFFESNQTEAVKNVMHNAIFVIVEKGLAEDVIEAAKQAGARGGTIINARGSGINDTDTVFAMPIEPEREIVLVIADEAITKPITEAVRNQLHIDEAAHGVLFVIGVKEAIGLY